MTSRSELLVAVFIDLLYTETKRVRVTEQTESGEGDWGGAGAGSFRCNFAPARSETVLELSVRGGGRRFMVFQMIQNVEM